MRFEAFRRWVEARPWRGLMLGALGMGSVLGSSSVAAAALPAAPETLAPERPAPAAAHDAAPPERWVATFGVFYPLSTHYGHADVTSSFDFNLLYSRVGSIDGGQLGGVNVVGRDDAAAPSSMRAGAERVRAARG